MTSPLGAKCALCDRSAPSNRECVHRKNVVEGRPQVLANDEKSLRNVPPCVYKEMYRGRPQAPFNDEKSLRKVPPMTSVWRPP